MKTILYITWDSDKTNYLESLFFPIFSGLQHTEGYRVIVYQFSWATDNEVKRLKNLASELGIDLIQHPIIRDEGRLIGTFKALWTGRKAIKRLIKSIDIDAVMPRSTMPATLVNSISNFLRSRSVKVFFEADGFPVQERIDFSGLNPKSLQAKELTKQELRILEKADVVLARSKKAIKKHLERLGHSNGSKFFAVSNGRDANLFSFDEKRRRQFRELLGIASGETCWVYVGSLGPAYAYEEMISLFDTAQNKLGNLRFLILPNDLEFAKKNLISKFPERLIIRKTPFQEIPFYLSAADLGVSFRKSAPSLTGLFPIKLGEYLLCGLPIIASLNTGDSEELLGQRDFVVSVDLDNDPNWEKTLDTYQQLEFGNREEIRDFGLSHFDLSLSLKAYLKAFEFGFGESRISK